MRCRLGGLALLAGLLLVSEAPAQVKFERKINEGTTRTVETSTIIEQKLTLAGMETDTTSDSRTTVKIVVGKRDAAGQVRTQETVEAMQIRTKIQGSEYEFDSANPDKTGSSLLEGVRPLHKALVGRVTTTVYDKDNAISAVEFDESVLAGVSPQLLPLVKSQLDPETIKAAANEEMKRLPTDAVKKGDTWERISKANLGAGQVLTSTTKYTYEGEVEKDGRKFDRITSKTLSVSFAIENSPIPIGVKASDLKPTESFGEMLFDRGLGQVVESRGSVRIVGEMTLTINGMELPAKLDLKMESSMQPKT